MRKTQKLMSAILATELAVVSIFTTSVSGGAMDTVPYKVHVAEQHEDLQVVSAESKNDISVERQTSKEAIDELKASIEESRQRQSDAELIALVTMAEAEGESEYGKRLVIDTILNRIDHPAFPNTASGVIYQSGQFEAMWNGRVNRCYVRDDIVQLVKEEMESRSNYDVMFFVAGGYSAYGTPLLAEGNHYFSSY